MSMDVSMSLPPAYFGSLSSLLPESETSDLPIYTRRPTPPPQARTARQPSKGFTVELSRKGKAWAVLTMLGDPASSNSVPTILEDSDIAGSVKLTLDSRDAIQSVVVSVKGHIITGANAGEKFTFLNVSTTLWSQSMGDPRNSPTSPSNQRYNGKLQGDYIWPFSISLPKEVILPIGSKSTPQVFRLPQTLIERHTRASVQYDINLRLTRKKLRIDDRMQIMFKYIPITKPGPPSPLRLLAYQENSPLWGPDADPEGWYTLEPVRIRGKVFNTRSVDAKCTLSLATPLCYTRGSVIPCFMVIETDDLQALDLLSSPKAIVVRLRCCVKHHADAEKPIDSYAWKDSTDHSQLAAWWTSSEGATDKSRPTRHINGELHLPIDLKPTSAMAHFRIEYSVVLFPFDTVAFGSDAIEPLCDVPVDIATAYAAGPRPRIYTPPGYEAHHAPAPIHYYLPSSSWM